MQHKKTQNAREEMQCSLIPIVIQRVGSDHSNPLVARDRSKGSGSMRSQDLRSANRIPFIVLGKNWKWNMLVAEKLIAFLEILIRRNAWCIFKLKISSFISIVKIESITEYVNSCNS